MQKIVHGFFQKEERVEKCEEYIKTTVVTGVLSEARTNCSSHNNILNQALRWFAR